MHHDRVTSTSPDVRDRRLRRARAASVVALVAFVGVGIASGVLVADGRGSLWLVLADALCAFVAVRTVVRVVAINRMLREGAED